MNTLGYCFGAYNIVARAHRLEAAMDAIALATTDGLREEAKGAAGDLAMELHCECPIHTFVVYCALAIERESRYLGVCEKTGLRSLKALSPHVPFSHSCLWNPRTDPDGASP